MALIKPRPTGGLPDPAIGGNVVRLRAASTVAPATAEWTRHFPVGAFVDQASTCDLRDPLTPGGLVQYHPDQSGSSGIVPCATHPDGGFLPNNLGCVLFTNGEPYPNEVTPSQVSTAIDGLRGLVKTVVAPFGRYDAANHRLDSGWFGNEAIAHDAATADPIAQTIVALYAAHPSVLAYSLADDITVANHGQRLATMAEAFQRADIWGRPATGVITDKNVVPLFTAGTFRLLLTYAYPCGRYANNTDTLEGDFHRSTFSGDWVDVIRDRVSTLPAGARHWWILQTHQVIDAPPSSTQLRYPTAREMRTQFWIAIGEGATGLFWFVWTDLAGQADGLGNPQSAARMAAAAELAGRLTPDIRERLLRCTKVADAFVASGGGSSGYPVNYANAYVSTLYDATDDRSYCVVCNHSTSTANVTITAPTLSGRLVNLETGVRSKLGVAVSLPALDGTIYELDPMRGVPVGTPDLGQNVETWWSTHWANPSSPTYVSASDINLHPNVVIVQPTDNLQAVIDAAPDYTTFRLRPGTHGRAYLIGRSHLAFVSDDPANRATLRGIDVFGNTDAQDRNTYVSALLAGDEEALYKHKYPSRDFYYRDLDYRSDGTPCRHDQTPTSNDWVEFTPGWNRAVRDVLYENCTYDNYFASDASGGTSGPPEYAEFGFVNCNAGTVNVWARNCTFHSGINSGGFGAMPHYFFLDGAQGSGMVGCSASGKYHSGGALFLTNDDFTFDVDRDGGFQTLYDLRNAHQVVIANNALGNAFTVIGYTGDALLVLNNTMNQGGALCPGFVGISSRCSKYYAQGVVYDNYDHVIKGNVLTNGNVTTFVGCDPNSGAMCTDTSDPNNPYRGRVGRVSVLNNSVGGTVGTWLDAPAGVDGPNVVSGNTP
jgi:hypothetical protein